jgi:mRNA interferase MazF
VGWLGSKRSSFAAAVRVGYGTTTMIPLTGTLDPADRPRLDHAQIDPEETGLRPVSTAQGERIRSIAISRIERIVGRLGPAAMVRVDAAIRVHLSLD